MSDTFSLVPDGEGRGDGDDASPVGAIEVVRRGDVEVEPLPHYAAIQRHAPAEAVALVEGALGARVSGVEKDAVGASHAIYFLRLEDGRDVVARLAIHPEHDLARDLWAMEMCRGRGVPAPIVLASQTDRAMGTPFAVLSRLPGRPAHAAGLSERSRERVLEQMAAYLARIHGVPMEGFGELRPDRRTDGGYVGSAATLSGAVVAGAERTLAELEALRSHPGWPTGAFPQAVLQRARECFERGREALDLQRAVLVHGDYRLKNALVSDAEVTGIVDFELAMAGDPAMDLAWLRVEDVRNEGEWEAVWRGYGVSLCRDAGFEWRLRLYELWWRLRRLWWEVMTKDKAAAAVALRTVRALIGPMEAVDA